MERTGVTAISVDAIFFDFDGVLAESNAIKRNAYRTLYRDLLPAERLDGVVDLIVRREGVPRVEVITECHREFLGVDLESAEVDRLAAHFGELVVDGVVASDWVAGARAFLTRVAGAIKLFVISGTPEPEMQAVVARRGMADYFTAVRGSPPRKPPILRGLLDDHGLAPERCLFVGDAPADLEAATINRVPFLGRVAPGERDPFPPGTRTAPDLTILETMA